MGRPATEAYPDVSRPTGTRHVVLVLATVMSFLLYLDRYFLSFLVTFIADDFGLNRDEVNWLLSVYFFSYALGQVPAGWFTDRFGARLMLTIYIAGWSLFTGGMGLAGSFAALLLLRLALGAMQAGAYPTGAAIISKWIPFRGRGFASSVVTVGGRVGGALAPFLTALLIVHLTWQAVSVIYGVVGLVFALAFWWGVRDRPDAHPGCNEAERRLIEAGRPATSSPHGKAGHLPLRCILRSRSLWCSSVSQFGTNIGWSFLMLLLPTYLAEAHAVPTEMRGVMSGLPVLVGLFGMLAGGWLTDRLTHALGVRWGRGLPMALTRFTAMAAYLACLVLSDPWLLTAAFCLVAVSTDMGTPAVWAFKQDVGGRYVGSILGWGNMWGNFGAALSPLLLNSFEGPHRWDYCFLACAASFLVAGVAALFVDARIPIAPEEA